MQKVIKEQQIETYCDATGKKIKDDNYTTIELNTLCLNEYHVDSLFDYGDCNKSDIDLCYTYAGQTLNINQVVAADLVNYLQRKYPKMKKIFAESGLFFGTDKEMKQRALKLFNKARKQYLKENCD